MKAMTMKTAIKKAKEGYFTFKFDIRIGNNEIRRQTPSGKWVNDLLCVTANKRTKKYTGTDQGSEVLSKAAWMSMISKTELQLAGNIDKETYFQNLLDRDILVEAFETGDRVKVLNSPIKTGRVVEVKGIEVVVLLDGNIVHTNFKTCEIEGI